MGQPQTQQRVQRASDISEFLLIFLKITGLSGFHHFGFLLSLAVTTNFLLYSKFSLSLCLPGPLCPLPGFSWCGTDGGPRGSVSNSQGQSKPVSAAVPLISGVIPPRQRQCLPVRLLGPAITRNKGSGKIKWLFCALCADMCLRGGWLCCGTGWSMGTAELQCGTALCRGNPVRIPSCTGLHAAENHVSHTENNILRNSIFMRSFHSPVGEIHRWCGSKCRRKQDGAISTTVTSVTGESWQACDNGKVMEATKQQVVENACNPFCVIPEGEMMCCCASVGCVHGYL